MWDKRWLLCIVFALSACSSALRNESINPRVSDKKRDSFLNQTGNLPTKRPNISTEVKYAAIRYNVMSERHLSPGEIYFFWTQVMVQSGVKPQDITKNLEQLRKNAAVLVPEYPSKPMYSSIHYRVPLSSMRRPYGPYMSWSSLVFVSSFLSRGTPPQAPLCRIPSGRALDALVDILLFRIRHGVTQQIVDTMNRCLSGADGLEPFYGLSMDELRTHIDTVAKRYFGYEHPVSTYSPR